MNSRLIKGLLRRLRLGILHPFPLRWRLCPLKLLLQLSRLTPMFLASRPIVQRTKGGYLIGGRFVRDYKNSRRPPWIWPEVWKMMHVAAREKEAAELEESRDRSRPLRPRHSRRRRSHHPNRHHHRQALPLRAPAGRTKIYLWTPSGFKPRPIRALCVMASVCPLCHEHAHLPILPAHELPFSAFVARPVNKAEVRSTPATQQALQKEWDKLPAAG